MLMTHSSGHAASACCVQTYFDTQATHIQRWFRGFWSRKYVHSFAQRKAYLAKIAEQNAQIRLLSEQEMEASIR